MKGLRTVLYVLMAMALLTGSAVAAAEYDPNAGCGEMPEVVENVVSLSGEIGDATEEIGYTTGLPELDVEIGEIFDEIGAEDMSQYRTLINAFLYVAANYTYMDHDWEEYGFGEDDADWTAHRALVFFQSGGGVCYDYASAFCVLARVLGYEAYNVVGSVFGREHGYVCIPQGDMLVLYDPELASVQPDLYPDLTLFQFLDHGEYEAYFWQ